MGGSGYSNDASVSSLGGGGGSNPLLMDYYNQLQNQYMQAKQANETRYGDINTGYSERYADAMGTLGQFSDQDKADVNKRFDQNLAKSDQSAISRGLYNTTVTDSLRRGVEDDRGAELRRVNDAKLQRQLGYQTGLSKEQLDFQERRNDTYPDQGLMAQVAMEAGKGGFAPGVNPVQAYSQASGASPYAVGSGTGQIGGQGTGGQVWGNQTQQAPAGGGRLPWMTGSAALNAYQPGGAYDQWMKNGGRW
jgi:hypothetical protein